MSDQMLIDLSTLNTEGKFVIPAGTRVNLEVTNATFKNGVSAKGSPWYLVNMQTEARDDGGENDGKWVYFGVFLKAENPDLETILTLNGKELPTNEDGKLILEDLLTELKGCTFSAEIVNQTRKRAKKVLNEDTGLEEDAGEVEVTDNKVKDGSIRQAE